MKKVLVLFGESTWEMDFPFKNSEKYRYCYEHFYSIAEKRGIKIYRASKDWFDKKEGVFMYAWEFSKGKWERVFNVLPEMIYDKMKEGDYSYPIKKDFSEKFPFINDPDFTRIAGNKFLVSKLFSEFSKPYIKVSSKEELKKELVNIAGNMVVLKPEIGSGGDGILIIPKDEALSKELVFPLIMQEFIDSSSGINGVTNTVHDLRLVFVNDKLIYSYIRIPREGSLLANLAQGGSMHIVENGKLPKSVDVIVDKIKTEFSRFPNKIYTLDLIFDEKQRPWIVEINTMPGMYFAPGQEKYMDAMYEAMVELFENILKEKYEKN